MSAPKIAGKSKSLAQSVFITVLAFTLLAVLATAIALISIAYSSEEASSEASLVAQARSCAALLEGKSPATRIVLLEDQVPSRVRYTLVDHNGVVIFDSAAGAAAMSNHNNRPEMLDAQAQGEGVLVRHSDTLHQDTLYVAERLNDGAFVRLSEERLSLLAFLGTMIIPVGIALFCAALVVILISRLLTSHIMRPLDNLDLARPLDTKAYAEMEPLLTRIDQQQQQLRRQNEELKAAEGLRREFSANVSHEMKTPLQVISGYAEMIGNGFVNPSDVQEFGNRIYGEARRLRALINDVLTLSRLDEASYSAAQFSAVNLLETTHRTCDRLEALAEERAVELICSGDNTVVQGSEHLLDQAISNLVANAIRYTPEGGTVEVRVFGDEEGAKVSVRDTGIGIPPEEQEKIFERFYRTEKSRSKETGGTGLGLAIVKHAALYHNGDVSVTSVPGEGSTFTLRLPA